MATVPQSEQFAQLGVAIIRGMLVVRYGIPLALLVAGVVVAGTSGSVVAGAMFVSAATAVLLLNVLYRIGVQGDRERDQEEEARRYFDEHGRWPD